MQSKYQCCSYCPATPVVLIEYSMTTKRSNDHRNSNNNHQSLKPPPQQPLCLLHFYTTDACREVSTNNNNNNTKDQCTTATIIDPIVFQQQLPPQQELFAEAYLQIQQQIQDAIQQQQLLSDSALENSNDDPLAIITDLNKGYSNNDIPRKYQTAYDNLKSLRPRMKKVKHQNSKDNCPEGGFLRHVPTPGRIIQVQMQQVQQQQDLIARMNQSNHQNDIQQDGTTSSTLVFDNTNKKTASSLKTVIPDLTQRRKPTRTNVWNIVSQDDRRVAASSATAATSIHTTTLSDDNILQHENNSITCTCGSTTVEVLSSNTNKSQDMTKAETWGNKDRHDEIIHRYLCHHCGKSWNDVE